MRKVLHILTFLFIVNSGFGQKVQLGFHGGTFWEWGLPVFQNIEGTFVSTNTFYKTNIGIEAKYKLKNNWSLVGGYDFSYRYLQVSLLAANPDPLFTGGKTFAHEIPLLLEYSFVNKKLPNKSLICRLGGGISFFESQYTEFGTVDYDTVFTSVYKYALFYTLYPPKDPIPFLQAYVGIGEYFPHFGNIKLGLAFKYYLADFEHEIYYYFNNSVSPSQKSIAVEARKAFSLHLDIAYSFALNKKRN